MQRPLDRMSLSAGLNCVQARESARRTLAEHDVPAALVDDVLTVVSELASNAMRHAGGITDFRVTVQADQVTIEVSDHSPLPPRLQPPSPHTPGGFGWRVVKTLAPTVFVRFHRGGKTIVASLPAPHRPPSRPMT
ncbi:ATP-binding protein [Streptomyces sp. NPDC006662]|uniref:ATP-binding protein n=1 Tax=Streptomyces sp. NPDC006662 TaxID=3156902 RepID=UPI0033F20DFC